MLNIMFSAKDMANIFGSEFIKDDSDEVVEDVSTINKEESEYKFKSNIKI